MSINWLVFSIIVIFVTILLLIRLRFQRKQRSSSAIATDKSDRTLTVLDQETYQPQQARKPENSSGDLQKLDVSQTRTSVTDSRSHMFSKEDLGQEETKLTLTTTLQELLIAQRWEEADRETLKIMLQLANREQEGWLDVTSIQNFPQQDLRAIDRLWVEASKGRFGFSIQQQIWQNVGGNIKPDDKIYEAFGNLVGWRVHQKWLQVHELTFHLSSPVGHLPATAVRLGGLGWGVAGFWWDRRDACVFLLSQKDW
ncbi:GUN4 domain-containing protein [Tolypothrix bouteillei VB521301_2]|uniref:GUN4 domain-containing protein n=1 Tax=Tolypothrix bouteillei TaxID=1246981 RepID=UPI000514458C